MNKALRFQLAACLLASLQLASVVQAQRPEPLPGLRAAATISIDGEGIAHVRANNEHDLYLLQGWTHARDRLFQMDVNRRLASGTLAELVGTPALQNDVRLRTIGLRRAAQRSHDAASERTRAALLAYAEGVNTWAASHPLPVEYGALELTAFTPWSPVDSIAIGKLISFTNSVLSFEMDLPATIAIQSYMAALGPERGQALFFQDLWRSAPFDPDATVPDAMMGATALFAANTRLKDLREAVPQTNEAMMRLMRGHLEWVRDIPDLGTSLGHEHGGSNIWAVSGPLARDGQPLIANDPHLGLAIPTIFYPMGLELPEEPVFGSSFPGAPGIIHGYSRHIAWGTSNSQMDALDLFSERVVPDPASPSGLSTIHMGVPEWLIPIPQTFRANQPGNGLANDLIVIAPPTVPAATLVMPRRDGGPIIALDISTGAALSVQYVGFSPTQEVEAFLMINRARNLAEFRDALQRFDAGSQNFVYADVEGNIAFFTAGEIPVREDLQDMAVQGAPPWFVRNGQGGNEWLGVQNPQPHQATPHEIVPFAEMPQLVNPPAGWFVNGNNDPLGLTRDNDPLNQLRPSGGLFYLGYSWNAGFRARRVNTRLAELLNGDDHRVSFEEMQAVQKDNILRDAQVLKPYIVAAFDRASTTEVPELSALAAKPGVAAAIARLRVWDGSTSTHSVEASIYTVWRSQMIARVIDSPLGPLPKPGDRESVVALRHMLDNFETSGGVGASGIDFFAAPGIAEAGDRRDYALLASLDSGLDLLAGLFGGSANQDDYLWGALQKIMLDHPLGAAFSIPPIPTDGGFQTVDPALPVVRVSAPQDFRYRFGSAHRSVYEVIPHASRGASIWAGGTSGDPFSPNYTQFLERWIANETLPLLLRKQEIMRSGAVLERYVPAPD